MWCCHKLLRLCNHNCSLANYGSHRVVFVSRVLLHIRHSLCMLSMAASSELQQELSICERDHVAHTSKLYTSWPLQEMLTVFHLGVWGVVLGSLCIPSFWRSIVTSSIGTWGVGNVRSSEHGHAWCPSLWGQSEPGPVCSEFSFQNHRSCCWVTWLQLPLLRKHETVLFMGLLSAYL